MNVVVYPSNLSGTISVPSSKSLLHRLLICSALADRTTHITCSTFGQDVDATLSCLQALGARITQTKDGLRILGIPRDTKGHYRAHKNCVLHARDSASTLRMLMPLILTLNTQADFTASKQLASRTIEPLYNELFASGATLSPCDDYPLHIEGTMRPGRFCLPGNISSQFISGLLFATPLLSSPSVIEVTHPFESKSYVDMTISTLKLFGIQIHEDTFERDGITLTAYTIEPSQSYSSPREVTCEGDWSNAAFYLAYGAVKSSGIALDNLHLYSYQGDKAFFGVLSYFGAKVASTKTGVCVSQHSKRGFEFDCANNPDLVMPLCILTACTPCVTTLTNTHRLQLKESNRIHAVLATLQAFDISCSYSSGTLMITGKDDLEGGVVLESFGDHRIVMLGSILGCLAQKPVTILNAEVVEKSYPTFFEDLAQLGGHIEKEQV